MRPTSNASLVECPRALVEDRAESDAWKKIDRLEDRLGQLTQTELPLRHIFTPGLYTREVFMPAGTIVTTRIHLQEHPFVISAGAVAVWDDENGWVQLRAPFTGVTQPGTRRVIYVYEPTIWTTFHVTELTDPDDVVRAVTFSQGKYDALGIASSLPTPPPLS